MHTWTAFADSVPKFTLPSTRFILTIRLNRPWWHERNRVIYSVRHTTTFRYDPAVRESVMEVRMQPRSESNQRCLKFQLDVNPAANIMQYRDFMGNAVHHFDIAQGHTQLQVVANSLVEAQPAVLPISSSAGDWADLDALLAADDHWEMLLSSQFSHPTSE